MKPHINKIIVAALAAGVLIAEVLTPVGYTEWILYIIPFIIATRFVALSAITYLSVAFTLLIITGFFVSPAGAPPVVAFINRVFGIVVIWLMTYLILNRLRTEERIQESERRYRELVQSANSIILKLDREGTIIFCNEFAQEFFGYSENELLGKKWIETIAPRGGPAAEDPYPAILEEPERYEKNESESIKKSGERVWISWTNKAVRDGEGRVAGILSVGQDVTERKRLEEEIRQMAHHDSLTGLPNRRFFRDIANVEVARARRYGTKIALLYLDLDKFKEINDSLGHDAGDELLKQAGERLRSAIRRSDSVARMGGDEFTILVPSFGDRREVAVTAKKIIAGLSAQYTIAGRSVHTSISVGISVCPDDGEDLNVLLGRADAAMYSVKEHGGNDFRFYGSEAMRKAS